MLLKDAIKKNILRMYKCRKLTENPFGSKFLYINDTETIRKQELEEYRVWYNANSAELQNYYTAQDMFGNAKEPIWNRNKPNYFWGIAVNSQESNYKKDHSGVPKSIVDMTVNVVGYPEISCEQYPELEDILKKNCFDRLLCQEARPLTFVLGDGCWKINIFNDETPSLEFVSAENVEYAYDISGKLIGVLFQSFYEYKDRKYVLFEIRRIGETFNEDGEQISGSIIEFKLFRLNNESADQVDFDEVPELANTGEYFKVLKGFNHILAVPNLYFKDANRPYRGASLFKGKVETFDAIDQCLSQLDQLCRVSTPAEYYPVDLLERDANNNLIMPSVFNRQFIKKEGIPDGEGNTDGQIQTTQPNVIFDQYVELYKSLINMALIGWLSPATLGFDIAKKDNAEAQREKEKVTLYLRKNVIDPETIAIKEVCKLLIALDRYLKSETHTIEKDIMENIEISVKYEEYAAPSFDNKVQVLLPLYINNAISVEEFVNRLYGEDMTEKEKEIEIERLKELKSANELSVDDFGMSEDITKNGENSDFEKQNENE